MKAMTFTVQDTVDNGGAVKISHRQMHSFVAQKGKWCIEFNNSLGMKIYHNQNIQSKKWPYMAL